ncbi:hypothetical protein [Pseudarthrobacter sp. NIBRBAC000502770]|uniref:hypothetical protein n=1 Tax=Pseudarthrobacter sp. NIBRBAC000502770 TaxID=2590785 RepID=UPI00143E0443|nr:hypothetical protein [Pseudarthrobacter sp. NIBRBAC000502770]
MTHDAAGKDLPERYGLLRPGVILTARALFKGWAITTSLWLMGLYAVLAVTTQGFWF